MGLDTAQVTTRSDTELCTIERIHGDTSLRTPARMELILAIALDWHGATQNSTGRATSTKEAKRREPLLWRISEKRRAIAPPFTKAAK